MSDKHFGIKKKTKKNNFCVTNSEGMSTSYEYEQGYRNMDI